MIDQNVLLTLFDDEVLVRKYLGHFVRDMPELLQKMRAASELQHWDELSMHAHTYKSQMQYIGDSHSTSMAGEIEKKSIQPNSDVADIVALIGQLENHLDQSLLEIKKIIG